MMIRRKILQSVDASFIHHKQYTRELPIKNFSGARYQKLNFISIKGKPEYVVMFKCNSATFPGEKESFQQICLLKFSELLKDKKTKMLMRDKVLKSISEGDLLLACSCESFLYHGYAFICTKKGIVLPRFKENRPPHIRNPQMRGIVCKHLDLVLSGPLVFNWSTIAADVKKKELA